MQTIPLPIARLIDELSRLPGVGPKTASRLAFHLLRSPAERSHSLAEAIGQLHESITTCSHCFNLTESNPCNLCSDNRRDQSLLCVVEEPLDVIAIERTSSYLGLYHVLHGKIIPTEGIGPEDLKISELISRVHSNQGVKEIILATNPNLEGEATAMYIARQFENSRVKITRLARGLPVGGDLEYADQITLSRALAGRNEM